MSAEPVPNSVLTLRLSMIGRSVKSFTFSKPLITVGRDPEADVFIDNPGVSREHLRFERAADGTYE
ncbi:FHA domain-containing protein, partial [Salmonella sp. SAL4433]|uniref:FHA domain-containing protein n=1 Tax=Salmonella sp. SAL4433 TaxID=3159888 RepID=UPI003979E626